jgi:hypothetical protein
MLLIKPKDKFLQTKAQIKLSFLRLSMFDQSIRPMKESIIVMKYCSSISFSAVTTYIMICRAEDVRNLYSTA